MANSSNEEEMIKDSELTSPVPENAHVGVHAKVVNKNFAKLF